MDTSSLLMIAAAVITYRVHLKSPKACRGGDWCRTLLIVEIAPRMVAVFTLAGLVQAVVPQETIVRWMGKARVSRYADRYVLGSITPGGPMTHFPVIASLYKVGVGVGPLVAYLSAWSLLRPAANYHVGDSVSGAKLVGIRVAVQFRLAISRRPAVRNHLRQIGRLIEHGPARVS